MSTVLVFLPVAVPATAAAVYAVAGWRRATAWVATGSAVIMLAVAVALAGEVVGAGTALTVAGWLRVDPLAAFMLVVIGVVAVLTAVITPAFLATELATGRASARTAARYSILVQLFLATMTAAVAAADLGLLWVAVEATTIVTAFLVGLRRTRAAVEAAWKYVVICSAGIALALLGLVVLNYAAHQTGTRSGLDLAGLLAAAPQLDPGVTRLAVLLLVIGFGTKAGLAPLHAWLPDAHSQAPAPVSALMSGVLLSVAFYAILRVKTIADSALGPEFARMLLVAVALVSLVVAVSGLLAQRDYKRMLAYSSIEHMGIIALGAAVGGSLATAAVLLHILGHGLVKCVAFLSAGHILQTTGTSRIDEIRGLGARQPVLAGCFGLSVLALIGLPPFSIFASELGIARAGFSTGSPAVGWATAAALVLLVVAAAALINHTSTMLLGNPADSPGAAPGPHGSRRAEVALHLPHTLRATLITGLLVAAAIGLSAGPLAALLTAAAHTVSGAP